MNTNKPARPILTLARPPARPIGPQPTPTIAKPPAQAKAKSKSKKPKLVQPKPPKPLPEERRASTTLAARLVRRHTRRQTIARLNALHPEVFNPNDPKPLAIGIDKAVREALGLSSRDTRVFIGFWVRQPRYLAAIIVGGPRYTIDGTPDGAVTPHQQDVAQRQLEALIVAKAAREAEAA